MASRSGLRSARAPQQPGSPVHVGYYGIALKRGTYTLAGGDPVEHISCKAPKRLHLTHAISNLNFICKHG